jgi:hypothetical protein
MLFEHDLSHEADKTPVSQTRLYGKNLGGGEPTQTSRRADDNIIVDPGEVKLHNTVWTQEN